MLESNPLSFLSWNPRISDHGVNYDDPWKRAKEYAKEVKNKLKKKAKEQAAC